MPSNYVPLIVLQVSTSNRTYRGSLRPPKRPSKAKNGQNITFLAISGSVLSNFGVFPTSPLKYEKNAAFGSHVALSVLQIQLTDRGKSTYQSTTKNSPKPIPLPSPLFFSIFLVDSWTQIIQGSSVGHITIHFRGLRGLRRAPKPKFWLFDQKKVFTEMLISPEPDVPQGWLRCQNDRWTKGYAHDHSD